MTHGVCVCVCVCVRFILADISRLSRAILTRHHTVHDRARQKNHLWGKKTFRNDTVLYYFNCTTNYYGMYPPVWLIETIQHYTALTTLHTIMETISSCLTVIGNIHFVSLTHTFISLIRLLRHCNSVNCIYRYSVCMHVYPKPLHREVIQLVSSSGELTLWPWVLGSPSSTTSWVIAWTLNKNKHWCGIN